MSTFTRVKIKKKTCFIVLQEQIFYVLDEKKIQQTTNNMDDASEQDLPHIDLNEMLADMTMEDSDKMDA